MLGLGTKISTPHTFNRKYVARATQKSSYFDGTTDYLMIADHNDFSPTDGSNNDEPFSFSCWIKRGDSTHFSLFSKGAASGTLEWRVFAVTNKLYFDILDNSASVYRRAYASRNFTGFGNWTHIVATYDGSEHQSGLKLYINGEAIGVNTTSASGASWDGIPNTSSELRFGHMQSAGGYDFNGYAADLMYWTNYELSLAQIKYLYASQPVGNYSVDPTKSANGGLYSIEAAAACIGWWKAFADYTITAASTSTSISYAKVNPADCDGDVAEIEVCIENGMQHPIITQQIKMELILVVQVLVTHQQEILYRNEKINNNISISFSILCNNKNMLRTKFYC